MTARREWMRNTVGLLGRAASKASDARRRAHSAIEDLVVEQRPVNFSTVAQRAGVSKTYLYNDAELRKMIEQLREQRHIRAAQQRQVRVQTDASLKVAIAAKDQQLASLRARVKQLERELALSRGRLYAGLATFGPPIA